MKKHIGSTIALVLGILLFISGITQPNIPPLAHAFAGLVAILGALAYRSAKKRLLSEVKTSLLRKSFEISAMAVIIILLLLQDDLINRMITRPVVYLIIPLWAIVAYIEIVLRTKRPPKKAEP